MAATTYMPHSVPMWTRGQSHQPPSTFMHTTPRAGIFSQRKSSIVRHEATCANTMMEWGLLAQQHVLLAC
jgi:hypothetical protein